MAVTMSRSCYEVTALPGVEMGELPTPIMRRLGRGTQAVWDDDSLLPDLIERVSDIYASSAGFDDEDAQRDRAAMRQWLRKHGVEPW